MFLDFDESATAFRSEVRDFLRTRLPADWTGITKGPEALELSFRICAELAERGWLAVSWPREYGGTERSLWEQIAFQEECWGHFEPRGGQYLNFDRVGPTIMEFGTEWQKQHFLPPIVRGEVQWAQLFSEPDSGSDLASLRTSAAVVDDGFVVNGEKVWTSYANSAKYGFLLARTLPESRRREGISVLLIDMDDPGVEVREIQSSLGWSRIHSVHFTDVHVPRERLLGELHNGWSVATATLSLERSGIARYARTTRIVAMLEGLPQAADPAFRQRLADALALGRSIETLTYSYAADEGGEDDGWLPSGLRALNGTYEQEVARLAEDMLGVGARIGRADADAPMRKQIEAFIVRQAPTGSVTGGSHEIQMSIIARRGLGLAR